MTQNRVRSGLRLGKELNDGLKEAARKMCMTKNQLMVKILYDWLEQNQTERKDEREA